MRRVAQIDVTSQSMRIYDYNDEFFFQIRRFLGRELSKYELVPIPHSNRKEKKITSVFACKTKDNQEVRLTVSVLKKFLDFLQYVGYNTSRIQVNKISPKEGADASFVFKEPWGEPLEHQVPWVKYQDAPGLIKINTMQTGQGKTFCALRTMVSRGKRTVITLQPKYMQTWMNAFEKFFDFTPDDVVYIQGGAGLNKTLEMLENGLLNPKIIVLSVPTLQSFMKSYEHLDPYLKYTPDQMWDIFNAGLRIQDEGHEAIHAVYKTLMYGNVPKTIILSATLEGDSAFINNIYELVYPLKERFGITGYNKYIECISFLYSLDPANKIKYKGRMGYSHVLFEQSIMKNKNIAMKYMDLINSGFREYYYNVREPGMKCLIFCSTVEFCLLLYLYLKNKYPDLSVNKYTAVDPEENYMTPDVIVSTPKSCGTGVDIPGLRTTLSPVAVGSKQLNEQMLGRLRQMKDPWAHIAPTYVWFTCEDIKPHCQYDRKRMDIFANKTLSIKRVRSGCSF